MDIYLRPETDNYRGYACSNRPNNDGTVTTNLKLAGHVPFPFNSHVVFRAFTAHS